MEEQEVKRNRRGETPEEYKARRYAERRAWAKANPEKTRAYGRKHYRENTQKRIANSVSYYHAHKAERSAYSKAYYRRKKLEDPNYLKSRNERSKARRSLLKAEREAGAPCRLPPAEQTMLERKIRHCYLTLNRDVFTAMARDRTASGSRVDAYLKKYPFEQVAARAIRVKIAGFGISRGKGEYDDCYDAGMLAYLYTMHRCAALNCDYVIPYLLKMIRIYIRCALVIYRDSHNICRVNNLKECNIDRLGAQRLM